MIAFSIWLAALGAAYAASVPPMKFELLPYDPVANSKAIVTSADGKARFTVLTPSIVRMEWSPNGKFEDRPSIAIVNRNLPVPKFTSSANGSGTMIETSEFKLQYTGQGANFSANNLVVTSTNSSSAFSRWNGGELSAFDPGNLMGTFRTLDRTSNVTLNCTENGKPHCEFGLVSRSGWALVDDSFDPVLDENDWWTPDDSKSVYPRASTTDWYLLVHGRDYRRALQEYTQIGGRIPIIPRWQAGSWFTRWYDWSSPDHRELVRGFQTRSVGLDVLVVDMNFHSKEDWSGWTVDPNLYPSPSELGDWFQHMGIFNAFNFHDADGVGSWEDEYVNMCKAMGLDPSTGKAVPCDFSNRTYAWNLEDIVLGALQKQFPGLGSWTDWQQGESGCFTTGGKMNPTIITDKLRATDAKRRAVLAGNSDPVFRSWEFARFGGLGNHRYQIGFSGDVAGLEWQNLAYQPYFSLSASNVGFGFWSHDIEGPGSDHEMYTRWIQWGAFSGAFRLHDRGMSAGSCKDPFPDDDAGEFRCSLVKPWNVPERYFEANRAAINARVELVPYIYTAFREAFDTGLSLIRPLYYYWPEEDMAYAADSKGNFATYMFGPDLFLAPVVVPSDPNTTIANVTFWLPPGNWFELGRGKMRTGPATLTLTYTIQDIPIFARAGSVVPRRPIYPGDTLGTARRQFDELEFTVYPGANSSSTTVYEDDGNSTAYLNGASAWITFSYTRTASSMSASISTTGSFPEMPTSRSFSIRIPNSMPLSGVTQDGKSLQYAKYGGDGTYSWSQDHIGAFVTLFPTSGNTTVTLQFASGAVEMVGSSDPLDGAMAMMTRGTLAKQALDRTRVAPGAHAPSNGYLDRLSTLGDRLALLAQSKDFAGFATFAKNLSVLYSAAILELETLEPLPASALVQLYDSSRNDHILCGSMDCRNGQSGYDTVGVEGWLPSQSQLPGHNGESNWERPLAANESALWMELIGAKVVPFNDWWNADVTDNYATTATSSPASGYSAADWKNGFVLDSSAGSNTAPLHCYFNSKLNDHMAAATAKSIAYAKDNGYETCAEGDVMGYVYTSEQAAGSAGNTRGGVTGSIDPNRFRYALGLLMSSTQ